MKSHYGAAKNILGSGYETALLIFQLTAKYVIIIKTLSWETNASFNMYFHKKIVLQDFAETEI